MLKQFRSKIKHTSQKGKKNKRTNKKKTTVVPVLLSRTPCCIFQ